jgi:redox-sensitive bicupin YhaK (pirin superfamily)
MLDLTDSRDEIVGAVRVRRALPTKGRRTVGAWCFADHMGPATVTETHGLDVGPHPHIGLQTVTWLVAGEVLHRDSLGSEQRITPGQLNLMTAGHGVSHSEEATGSYRGDLHGIQLWIALPDRTRDGAPAFEHHAELPRAELGGATATVLEGALGAVVSPARHDTDLVGAELDVRGPGVVPLRPDFEHALVVLDGAVRVGDDVVAPGRLGYLAPGRGELPVAADHRARVMLLGGLPFGTRPVMWWNFVARSHEEIDAAYESWRADDGRFGRVASSLPRIDTAPPWWREA